MTLSAPAPAPLSPPLPSAAPMSAPMSNPPSAPSAQGRPLEIELPDNALLIHPLSRRLVSALIPTAVTPNMVSLAGVAVAAVAAFFYTRDAWPWGPVAGFAAHVLWHVLDGADGDLARRTGRVSVNGELLDGICDYAGRIILYVSLAFFCASRIGPLGLLLAAGAGASRVVQANAYESLRRNYKAWVYGVGWIRQTLDSAPKPGLTGALGRLFLAISVRVSPSDVPLERALAAAPDASRARELCREHLAPVAFRGGVLSTNAETVVIFVTMLLGGPELLFAFILLAMNAAYLVFYFDQKARMREVVAAMG